MKRPTKSPAWFRPIRGSYLPTSNIGLLVYLVYVAYLVVLIVAWFNEGRTLWRLVAVVIPLMVAAAVLMQYIAAKHSK
jgi:ABC-type transport system involved in cytochrome c biogenesis permease subunit